MYLYTEKMVLLKYLKI